MTKKISEALYTLVPKAEWYIDGDDYNTIQWFSPNLVQPTLEELQAEIVRLEAQAPIDACKIKAKKLLADTDWAEMPSVTDATLTPHLLNVAEFAAYRAAIRGFVISPVANPCFPTVPTAQWSS
jgi:hypothetical protein